VDPVTNFRIGLWVIERQAADSLAFCVEDSSSGPLVGTFGRTTIHLHGAGDVVVAM